MNANQFAERFTQARTQKKFTLKQLSEQTGISVSALSHYANGANLPPLDAAVKIADALAVSLDWLCGADSNNESGKMNDCGDLIRALSSMLTTKTIHYEPGEGESMYDEGDIYGATFSEDGNSIIIESRRVPCFVDFQSWSKLLDLLRKKVINEEIYTAWIEKKITQAEEIAFPCLKSFNFGAPVDVYTDPLF